MQKAVMRPKPPWDWITIRPGMMGTCAMQGTGGGSGGGDGGGGCEKEGSEIHPHTRLRQGRVGGTCVNQLENDDANRSDAAARAYEYPR